MLQMQLRLPQKISKSLKAGNAAGDFTGVKPCR